MTDDFKVERKKYGAAGKYAQRKRNRFFNSVVFKRIAANMQDGEHYYLGIGLLDRHASASGRV